MSYETLSVERKYWTLFRNKYVAILDRIQQEMISKVCDVFISIILNFNGHVVDLKNYSAKSFGASWG